MNEPAGSARAAPAGEAESGARASPARRRKRKELWMRPRASSPLPPSPDVLSAGMARARRCRQEEQADVAGAPAARACRPAGPPERNWFQKWISITGTHLM
ncbi:hypothetical protein NDU88_001134 [Pleurodeles waltl]|uniref:Uncharacterized protein n=1 Tax=Pleurodeles waltl TaxID=8319 RepID=A0AAV7R8V2_PLEWA|nr:hypothetical protein NDU88_001134 [Pleurodeles waltl]